MRPASIFDMSRMSLMTSSRYWPLWWMSRQYSRYLSVPSGPNIPDSMISEKPMMALSGVRSSWLILARNFDLVWFASSARVFSSAYFSRELGELLGLIFELLLRVAQVGDRRHQALLAVHQLVLVQLDSGDVGADRDIAAVLGAALADVQPAAVVELRLEGAGARRLTLARAPSCARPACVPPRPRRRRRRRRRSPRRQVVQLLEVGVAQHQPVLRRPTARRLPGSSRWRRAAADRPRPSSRPGSSAR